MESSVANTEEGRISVLNKKKKGETEHFSSGLSQGKEDI